MKEKKSICLILWCIDIILTFKKESILEPAKKFLLLVSVRDGAGIKYKLMDVMVYFLPAKINIS
jgi:hypothetical protein